MEHFKELDYIDDQTTRDRLYESARKRLRNCTGHWIPFIVITVFAIALLATGSYWSNRYWKDWGLVAFVSIWSFFVPPITWFTDHWHRQALRRLIRLEMLDRGYAICVDCGYDLRGQQEPRCPECGAQFPGTLPETR